MSPHAERASKRTAFESLLAELDITVNTLGDVTSGSGGGSGSGVDDTPGTAASEFDYEDMLLGYAEVTEADAVSTEKTQVRESIQRQMEQNNAPISKVQPQVGAPRQTQTSAISPRQRRPRTSQIPPSRAALSPNGRLLRSGASVRTSSASTSNDNRQEQYSTDIVTHRPNGTSSILSQDSLNRQRRLTEQTLQGLVPISRQKSLPMPPSPTYSKPTFAASDTNPAVFPSLDVRPGTPMRPNSPRYSVRSSKSVKSTDTDTLFGGNNVSMKIVGRSKSEAAFSFSKSSSGRTSNTTAASRKGKDFSKDMMLGGLL